MNVFSPCINEDGPMEDHASLSRLSMLNRAFVFVAGLALGFVFLYSSFFKIGNPYQFLGNVYSYEIATPRTGQLVAIVLPWLEALVGVLLIGRVCVPTAFLISSLLLATFSSAQLYAVMADLSISCGCFSGNGTAFVSYGSLTRTVLLLLVSVAAFSVSVLKTDSDLSLSGARLGHPQ